MARAKSILLVEDDADFEAIVSRVLQQSGIAGELIVARNAGEAMGYLLPAGGQAQQGTAPTPCVVFLDLSLPSGDGLDLLRCIRSDYAIRSLPVVIFSGSTEEGDIRRAYAGGANSYVHKPTNAERLFDTVRMLARYWLTLNEPPPRF